MPYEVSRFGPQTWEIALNLEHWDKVSWKNRSPSGILSPKPVNCASHREIDEPLSASQLSSRSTRGSRCFPQGADLLFLLLGRKGGGSHTEPKNVLEVFRFGRGEACLPLADRTLGDRSCSARPACIRPMLVRSLSMTCPKVSSRSGEECRSRGVFLALHMTQRHPNRNAKQQGRKMPPAGG